MRNFIQSEILLILLTIVSIIHAPYPYLCMFVASLLMIVFCIRSLSEEESFIHKIICFILTGAFCLSGNCFLSALMFRELHISKKQWLNLSLPSFCFALIEMIKHNLSSAEILLFMLIVLLISALLFAVEWLIDNYINAKSQIAKAVSVTAVNELYEKKLNKELTIKNYLSDRTTRLEERENISRNIHNSVGHSITAAVMTLDAADMLFETKPDIAREKMHTANDRIKESLQSIRHAVRVLDEDNLYVSLDDLKSECASIIDNFTMDTMLRVQTDFQEDISELTLPHEQAEFLTGAVQELLTNGLRHGHADTFTVRLTADSSHIRLQVADNGKSDFDAINETERIQNGFGLKKLIAYTEKCGGTLKLSHEIGLSVTITLPLHHNTENKEIL